MKTLGWKKIIKQSSGFAHHNGRKIILSQKRHYNGAFFVGKIKIKIRQAKIPDIEQIVEV